MRKQGNFLILALIILTGLGLLAAAINAVRERAWLAQCTNQSRQIGIALDNHVVQRGHFPRGTVANETLSPEKRLSWIVETLPYMESTYIIFDRGKPWDADDNLIPKFSCKGETPAVTRGTLDGFKQFLCPGNPVRGESGRPSFTHYVGIAGVGKNAADGPLQTSGEGPGRPEVGVFGYDREVKPEDIKDGRANTMAVTETRVDNGPWTAGGSATVRGLEPRSSSYLGRTGAFGGNHAGGALVAFADGSARFIGESIHPEVFRALATIAGGEEVGRVGE